MFGLRIRILLMKLKSNAHMQRGFTLIELLVVIAIILVLAGAGFAVGNSALNKARRVSAQNTATSIDQAINLFYSEYGTFPADQSPINTGNPQGQQMLQVLLGKEPAGNAMRLNARNVNFLNIKEGKRQGDGGSDGIVFTPDGSNVIGIYDPWGNGFTVEIDLDFNDFVQFTPMNIDGATQVQLNGRRVAVYSPGIALGERGNLNTMVKSW